MIPEITNVVSVIPKVQVNAKHAKTAVAVGAGLGSLAVLSTRQAWPYCQGLGTPEYTGNPNHESLDPDDPLVEQLKQVGGFRGAVNRIEDMCANVQEQFASASEHFHDGFEHVGHKAHDAFENTKDFLSGLFQ